MSRARITVKTGAFAPILGRGYLAAAIAAGRYRFTGIGLEKRCSICREYWPADTEFYHSAPSNSGFLTSACKACYAEQRRARRRARNDEQHTEAAES